MIKYNHLLEKIITYIGRLCQNHSLTFLPLLELVLKVRIQNPSLRENDFIEIELDRQELTYQELLRVSCCELGVNPDQVEKIRKLPNTLVRKVRKVY